MVCGFWYNNLEFYFKFILMKEVITHYIGKSGKLYEYDKYSNFGTGISRGNIKDLPLDDYPYKLKYNKLKRTNVQSI